ncbi:hypothetical protein BJ138DRAFT_122382 [Hygrophoropsis aurantiaca]|uniref:Uncharacterized protein n=1 Tax=Hygrophoropsis aurantiaca TaxID=72124 RepID=A0ACB8AQB0_9AGAM|nr:hypothetical protein BJ138DRAFT_122382 [Hygrophoropsis aurantiaca]
MHHPPSSSRTHNPFRNHFLFAWPTDSNQISIVYRIRSILFLTLSYSLNTSLCQAFWHVTWRLTPPLAVFLPINPFLCLHLHFTCTLFFLLSLVMLQQSLIIVYNRTLSLTTIFSIHGGSRVFNCRVPLHNHRIYRSFPCNQILCAYIFIYSRDLFLTTTRFRIPASTACGNVGLGLGKLAAQQKPFNDSPGIFGCDNGAVNVN